MDVRSYLAGDAREAIRAAIGDAGGNEVFFVGRIGDDGRVTEAEVHCRGSQGAVPALLRVPRAGEAVIHNHPSGQLVPSDADLQLATRFGQDGVGFYIVDNEAEAIYVVVEPHRPRQVRLDADRIAATFAAGGPLDGVLDAFEPRPSQESMARLVVSALDDGGVGVVEAGTGTGKSLAYLVPLASHALANRVRVAVATGSINLQQQLVTQDLPIVERVVGPLKIALVKGRANYLCRRKLATALQRLDDYADDERAFLEQMARWAAATEDGSLSDLPHVPEPDLWELVRSDRDQTLRSRCPHFQDCFYYTSRRRAAAADVLVVNHHLLMVDLDLRHALGDAGVLPRYEALVVDEAHHLEEVASSLLATQATPVGIERLIGRLVPKGRRRRGLLRRLLDRLPKGGSVADAIRDQVGGGLAAAIEEARTELPLISAEVCRVLEEQRAGREEDGGGRSYRLPDRHEAMPAALQPLVEHIEVIRGRTGSVSARLGALRRTVGELPESWLDDEVQLVFDLRSVHDRLSSAVASLGAVLSEEPDLCRWIELRKARDGKTRPAFRSCPIDVAPAIRERLIDGLPAVVLTSATLTVDRRFDYTLRRIGVEAGTLAAERTVTAQLESPFDFERQVWMGVPEGMPDPRDDAFPRAAVDVSGRLAQAVGGRTFVLFTSYALLRAVGRALEQRLDGFRVLMQGTMERGRLLDEFRSGHRTVLLGTDSFWEGVDVPGRALSCVVLTRLPFRVPTDPLHLARAERIEARGGDPFLEYAVPQAVIRFRQGFGRLIRHRRDRGAVIVLDPRVVTMRYGGTFLRSLPPVSVRRLRPDAMAAEVARFLVDGPPPAAG